MATKKSLIKKKVATQQPQQDQQAIMQEFLSWFANKQGIDPTQAEQSFQSMPDEQKQQVIELFKQEKQQGQAQTMKIGGKLNHITRLLSFKEGGNIKPGLTKSKMPIKKLKMKGVQADTADIPVVPTKTIDIKAKPIIKKKK